jgi:hypothetical protein
MNYVRISDALRAVLFEPVSGAGLGVEVTDVYGDQPLLDSQDGSSWTCLP